MYFYVTSVQPLLIDKHKVQRGRAVLSCAACPLHFGRCLGLPAGRKRMLRGTTFGAKKPGRPVGRWLAGFGDADVPRGRGTAGRTSKLVWSVFALSSRSAICLFMPRAEAALTVFVWRSTRWRAP